MVPSIFLRCRCMDPRGWYGGTFLDSSIGYNREYWWHKMCRQALVNFCLLDVPIVVGPAGTTELLVYIMSF